MIDSVFGLKNLIVILANVLQVTRGDWRVRGRLRIVKNRCGEMGENNYMQKNCKRDCERNVRVVKE